VLQSSGAFALFGSLGAGRRQIRFSAFQQQPYGLGLAAGILVGVASFRCALIGDLRAC
jgi:hypothetical protein